jgi:hypothetical protein
MAPFAQWYALALTGYHDFHPEWLLPFALFVQICQFAYMMHLYIRVSKNGH